MGAGRLLLLDGAGRLRNLLLLLGMIVMELAVVVRLLLLVVVVIVVVDFSLRTKRFEEASWDEALRMKLKVVIRLVFLGTENTGRTSSLCWANGGILTLLGAVPIVSTSMWPSFESSAAVPIASTRSRRPNDRLTGSDDELRRLRSPIMSRGIDWLRRRSLISASSSSSSSSSFRSDVTSSSL